MAAFLTITSKDNPLIKKTASLLKRASRYEEGLFILEGAKLVVEAIESDINIEYAFFDDEAVQKEEQLADKLFEKRIKIYKISKELMKKISDSATPSGILCVARLFALGDINNISTGKYLALEKMQDPGNFGAVLRIADAFSLDGVLIDRECADIYSPKTIRGSMGSCFRVKVFCVSDLENAINGLKEKGFTAYAADLNEKAKPISEVKWSDRDIVIIGNEGRGISQNLLNISNKPIYIPMRGRAESLNASVAAGIIAYRMTTEK
jgi:TrmH family RNA methyltransferase